jgi:hypothetical protein
MRRSVAIGSRVSRNAEPTSMTAARVALALIGCAAFAMPAQVAPGPIIKQIDHILFVTGPDGRDLVALLRDKLSLPVVFDGPALNPPARGTGIGFGNVTLEVIPAPAAQGEPPRIAKVTSLAVQAINFASTPEALRASGIDHFPPAAGPTYAGDSGPNYTTIGLRGLGHPMFFIEYRDDMDARRGRFERALRERDGGPLGVVRMSEVAITSSNLAETREQWSRLLGGPSPNDAALWPAGTGPAIRFVAGDDPRQGRMVVIVTDLRRAADHLKSLQIPAVMTSDGLQIDAAAIWGLRLVLRE